MAAGLKITHKLTVTHSALSPESPLGALLEAGFRPWIEGAVGDSGTVCAVLRFAWIGSSAEPPLAARRLARDTVRRLAPDPTALWRECGVRPCPVCWALLPALSEPDISPSEPPQLPARSRQEPRHGVFSLPAIPRGLFDSFDAVTGQEPRETQTTRGTQVEQGAFGPTEKKGGTGTCAQIPASARPADGPVCPECAALQASWRAQRWTVDVCTDSSTGLPILAGASPDAAGTLHFAPGAVPAGTVAVWSDLVDELVLICAPPDSPTGAGRTTPPGLGERWAVRAAVVYGPDRDDLEAITRGGEDAARALHAIKRAFGGGTYRNTPQPPATVCNTPQHG